MASSSAPKRPAKVSTGQGVLRALAEAREQIALVQRDAALDALSDVLRVVRSIGGFMPHLDQQRLRAAEALLVELGRKV